MLRVKPVLLNFKLIISLSTTKITDDGNQIDLGRKSRSCISIISNPKF